MIDRWRVTAQTLRTTGKRTLLDEATGALAFRVRLGRRRAARRRFLSCATPDDYLRFAVDHFPGPFSQLPSEILPFLDFAASRSPRTVSEIGTQFGGTNFLLSQAIPTVTTMVGVDLLVRNRARLLAFRRPGQRIHLLNGSSRDPSMPARVSAALGGRVLDLLFIDGDHAWDGVVHDFCQYRSLVAPGGLIVFHDIIPDDRLRGRPPSPAYAGEVPLLWERLKGLYPSHEFVEDRAQEGFGIGVLEYDPNVAVPTDAVTR